MSARKVAVGPHRLPGVLTVPADARGLVVFAHGSGSSHASPRNVWVADQLHARGLGTLLFDLLTEEEGRAEDAGAMRRFDIPLLATRLHEATRWAAGQPECSGLPLGYFGASTGAAAALVACGMGGAGQVAAIVSRGGRPDLAGPGLDRVHGPVLLVVGGRDTEVLALNRDAKARLRGPCQLAVVPDATHLFEEPGALGHVARLAGDWFTRWFAAKPD